MKRQEMLIFKIEVTTVTKENLVFEGVSVCNESWLPVVYQKNTNADSSAWCHRLAECLLSAIVCESSLRKLSGLWWQRVLQTGNKSVCMASGDGMINKSGTTKRVTFSLDSKLNLECRHQVWPHSFSYNTKEGMLRISVVHLHSTNRT